jgi:hypothetical protein
MGLREKLRRLEAAAHGEIESFELRDGSRFYYDYLQTAKQMFLHSLKCLSADSLEEWPAPLQIHAKILEAKDPGAVLASLDPPGGPQFASLPYDRETLISERCLVPLYTGPVEDLSEPTGGGTDEPTE